MDWKQRAKGQIANKGWRQEAVVASYNSAAKRRGMVRVSKKGITTQHSITPAALSHWLNGTREPGISEFLALAEALEISPAILIAGQNLNTPSQGAEAVRETIEALLSDPDLTSRTLAFSAKMAAHAPKPKKRPAHRRK